MTVWDKIRTAPLKTIIVLANEKTGVVEPGYGDWESSADGKSRSIQWTSTNPLGIGRFRATHWAPMPIFSGEQG